MVEQRTLNPWVAGSSPARPILNKMKEFELIEHTADVGLRVYGKDLPDLFANAAKGLFSLITDSSPPEGQEKTILQDCLTLLQ